MTNTVRNNYAFPSVVTRGESGGEAERREEHSSKERPARHQRCTTTFTRYSAVTYSVVAMATCHTQLERVVIAATSCLQLSSPMCFASGSATQGVAGRGGVEGALDPRKNVRGVRVRFDLHPPPLEKKVTLYFIQNCCWITLQVSFHQGCKTCVKMKGKN